MPGNVREALKYKAEKAMAGGYQAPVTLAGYAHPV